MTTPEQLAERLGLEDFDTFALNAMWRLANHRFRYRDSAGMSLHQVLHRQQGHSTRNILAALCRLTDTDTDKQIVLVADSNDMQHILVEKAGDWALHLGIDPRRIKGATGGSRSWSGLDPEDVFVDHVVHEIELAA